VLSKVLAKTRQSPGQLPPRTTNHLLFVSNHRLNRPMSLNRMSEVRSGVFLDSE
jgi:hypothetical protein